MSVAVLLETPKRRIERTMTQETNPLSAAQTAALNTPPSELIACALRRGEGRLAATGALAVETGVHTGRSAQDKFIVRDALTEETVWWDHNKPIALEQFDRLVTDVLAHARKGELFVQDL